MGDPLYFLLLVHDISKRRIKHCHMWIEMIPIFGDRIVWRNWTLIHKQELQIKRSNNILLVKGNLCRFIRTFYLEFKLIHELTYKRLLLAKLCNQIHSLSLSQEKIKIGWVLSTSKNSRSNNQTKLADIHNTSLWCGGGVFGLGESEHRPLQWSHY